jgi:hypothetical protein
MEIFELYFYLIITPFDFTFGHGGIYMGITFSIIVVVIYYIIVGMIIAKLARLLSWGAFKFFLKLLKSRG